MEELFSGLEFGGLVGGAPGRAAHGDWCPPAARTDQNALMEARSHNKKQAWGYNMLRHET